MEAPVYSNKTILVNVLLEIEAFLVGVPDCVLFRLDFPTEEFYIQSDSKNVWVPTYNKFYNSDRYCVDELNGFTPFLCFTNATQTGYITESNTVGKNFYSCLYKRFDYSEFSTSRNSYLCTKDEKLSIIIAPVNVFWVKE